VALVFDYESAWAWETQPQGADFDYFRLCFEAYRALRRLGLDIDIVPPTTADLSPYRLALVPGLCTLSDTLTQALTAFRGTVLAGPRTNAKTPDFAIPVPLPPNLPGLAAKVARVESLPPGTEVRLAQGGAYRHWFEHLDTAAASEHTQDGAPAIATAGKLHYLAGWPDEDLWHRLLHAACGVEGIETHDLPDSLRLRGTPTHHVLMNYGPAPVTWAGHTLPPAGVKLVPR
jgi:beta-galactosidase